MEKEFVPYEQALDLKGLDFDEPCIQQYSYDGAIMFCVNSWGQPRFKTNKESLSDSGGDCISAPTFSQAFRWFREKYDVYHFVTREVGINTSDIFFVASYYKGKKGNSTKDTCVSSKTYEEAELECLKKLIEIYKKENEQS